MRDWALTAGVDGPPHLMRRRAGGPDLHIAISHSGDQVACAVDEAPIGVDLECPRPRDLDRLAAAVCTPAERADLQARDADGRRHRFYVAWTLKEAWLKQRGDGVSIGRLATLDTCAAGPRERPDAWSWRHGATVLSLAARALPERRFGDAAGLGDALAWRVRDLVTSP